MNKKENKDKHTLSLLRSVTNKSRKILDKLYVVPKKSLSDLVDELLFKWNNENKSC